MKIGQNGNINTRPGGTSSSVGGGDVSRPNAPDSSDVGFSGGNNSTSDSGSSGGGGNSVSSGDSSSGGAASSQPTAPVEPEAPASISNPKAASLGQESSSSRASSAPAPVTSDLSAFIEANLGKRGTSTRYDEAAPTSVKTDAEGNALKPVSGSVASRPDTKPEVKNPVTVNPKPTTEPVSQAVKSVAKPSVNRIGRRHRVDDDMARSTTAEAYAAENRKKREEARKEQANEERETNKAPKQNQANASSPRRSKKFSEGLKREIPRQELLKILQFGRRHGRNLDSIEDAFEYFNDMGENGYLADRVSTGANNLEAREDMLNRALQGKFYNVPNWREEMGGSDLDFDLETYFNDLENPKHKPKRPERLSDSEPGQVNEGTLNQDDMVNAQADQFEKEQSVRDQYRGEHKDVYADLRRNDSIDRIEKAIQQARIPTDMTKEERDAFYVEDYIPFCQWLDIDPYESFEFITRTISRYYGLAPDRNGQYFKQDEDVTGLTRGDFQRAFANIMENVNGGNHPFAYTRPNMRFHGTRVFPIPHSLTRKEAEVWANKMNGYTASEVEQLGRDIWLNDVQPRINYGDPWCTPAQREAIYDLSDAFEELTWESFRTENQGECPFRFSGRIWGTSSRVSDWFNSGSAEAVKDEGEQVDPHIRDRSAEVQRNMAASFEYQNKKTRPNRKARKRNPDGSTVAETVPDSEVVQTDSLAKKAMSAYISFDSFTSTLLNPGIAMGSLATRASGLTSTSLYRAVCASKGHQAATPTMRMMCSDPRMKNAFANATELAQTGMANVTNFIAENGRLDDRSRQAKIEQSGNGKVKQTVAMAKSMNGEVMYLQSFGRSIDVANWLDVYLSEVAKTGDLNDSVITQMQREIAADPTNFLSQALLTKEGRTAFVTVSDSSMGAINPTTVWLNSLKDRHPALYFATWLTLKFPSFCFNAAGKITPLSHTAMYLVNRGYYAAKGDQMGLQNLIGGEDTFGQGLLRNLALDMTTLGSNMLIALASIATIQALGGVEPPEDPQNIYDWTEWKVGGKPVYEINWMFSDTWMLAGGPLAVAICAANTEQGQQIDESGKPVWFGIFEDGAYRTLSQCGFIGTGMVSTLYDAVELFNYDGAVKEWEAQGLDSNNAVSPFDYFTAATTCWLLKKATAPVTWSAFNNFLNSEHFGLSTDLFATNPYKIYDPYSEEGSDDTVNTSFFDSQIRKTSQYNVPVALLMDVATGIFGIGQSNTLRRTGYMATEQPLKYTYDEAQMACFNYLDIDNTYASDEEKMANGQKVFELMGKFNFDAGLMADNAVVIPYDARDNVYNYLKAQKEAMWDEYNRKVEAGEYANWTERSEAKQACYDFQDQVSKYIDVLYDKSIPTFATKYQDLKTTYHERSYTEDENGSRTPMSNVDRIISNISSFINGTESNAKSESYATGRIPSSVSPLLGLTEPDRTDGQGWNYEQTPDWYSEDSTNADLMRDAFGYEGSLSSPYGSAPTIGKRATVSLDQGETWKDPDSRGEGTSSSSSSPSSSPSSPGFGTTTSNSGRSYTYYRRSSGSGGGYSSKISIYSRPASSLSADRAATMYSKNRNYTKYDYIRPDFETKGSRDAYKRSDI